MSDSFVDKTRIDKKVIYLIIVLISTDITKRLILSYEASSF